MILPFLATMQAIDPRLIQAAESLGASKARAFLVFFFSLAAGLLAGY
jgi:ABC-type spermidine/putrescine transport system permease subunit I